jgi:hypothetical protein
MSQAIDKLYDSSLEAEMANRSAAVLSETTLPVLSYYINILPVNDNQSDAIASICADSIRVADKAA